MATFNTELSRAGPGLFLRDLGRDAPDIDYVLERMGDVGADVWVLQSMDYDADLLALSAFAERAGYPHLFALPPNSGLRTGLDLNGDGETGTPQDAQGYGAFSGQDGMAILSRYPVRAEADLSALIWAELPWATLPTTEDGAPFPSAEVWAVQRLSTTGHWRVALELSGGELTILTAHSGTPAFDGPEDRNGLRNADELRLVGKMLGEVEGPAVVVGNFNLDPQAGDGRRGAMVEFLANPRLQDALAGQDTVDFERSDVGRLRVSYVLPTADLEILDAGVAWQDRPTPQGDTRFTRHHPVWVELTVPPAP
ncbi:MAG: endonuclease/exonuclease/phosphatase family protein [Pseudomonadota bacterium]